MMTVDIDRYLSQKKKMIDQALNIFLPESGSSQVAAAMRYSVESGGKRLRPVLTLATAETFGLKTESVIELSCALELIHTYSLIHDDLPAMDDSDLRRGRPSCHYAFGEAIAILAGDALLTMAFELIARYGLREGRERQAVRISFELARASGIVGMIGGQELDLRAEGKSISLAEVENIAELKTGALLRAAVKCGALASEAGERELVILDGYAHKIGKAFQIIDDVLDQEGNTAELGKPAGADHERAKATYAAIRGNRAAKSRAEMLYLEALNILKKLDLNTEILSALAAKLVYRKK
jgi:geranylgeranyl diphosphate synthase, type II